jgi:hypothetical protein
MKNNRMKAWVSKTWFGWRAKEFKVRGYVPCEIVFNNGWIHISERKPTKKDADKAGRILMWNVDKDIMQLVYVDDYYTYYGECKYPWQHCLKSPKATKK